MKKLLTALTVILVGTLCFATLSTDYAPEQYNTNGSTTQFQIQWGFFSTTDLTVYYTDPDGVDTTLTEGSGAGKYTVYAPNSDYSNGATITTGTTYPSSGKITIERVVPNGQELSINGDFIPAKPLETQLDKLAAQNQQTADSIGRTITIPVTDPSTITTELVNADTRAGLTMGFDASGNVTVLSPVTSGTIYVDEDTLTMTTNLISVKAEGITSNELADLSVLNTNIVDDAVQTRNILDGDVTTAKLDDDAVTFAKMAHRGGRTVIGNATGGSLAPAEISLMDDDTFATATTNLIASATDIYTLVTNSVYDSDVNFYESSAVAMPADDTVCTNAHGLGSAPIIAKTYAYCTNAVNGWVVGDLVEITFNTDISYSSATWCDATNVYWMHDTDVYIPQKDETGTYTDVTTGNFQVKFRAWK